MLRLWLPTAVLGLTCLSVAAEESAPTIGGLPLTLFENPGTLGEGVEFIAHRSGMTAWFAPGEFTVRFADRAGARGFQGAAMRYAFVGADPEARWSGEDAGPGKVNLLLGNDPGAWQRHLAVYGQVRSTMYPGVDVVVHGRQGRLTYDVMVSDGADPSVVRIRCEGIGALRVDEHGHLVGVTPYGEVRHTLPVTWRIAEDGSREAVESSFVVHADGTFGFQAPRGEGALLIDPGLTWSAYLGGGNPDGSGNEHGCGVDVDDDCGVYVAGDTLSLNFPTTVGAFDVTHNGNSDAYITKVVGKGNALLFSTFVGGTGGDFGHGVSVDDLLFPYLAGGTDSADFPTTGAAFDPTYNGAGDVFVTKLTQDGSSLVYSTYVGGTNNESSLGAHGLEVDEQGNAFVTGETGSSDFPTTMGALDETYNGGFRDSFVFKMAPDGGSLVYSTFVGGSGPGISDSGTSINIDDQGAAYVVGLTTSTDFPTTPGSIQPNPPGSGTNAFVFKLNAAGNAFIYSTYIGGTGDVARAVAADANGETYTVGFTASNVFPTTPGAFDVSANGFGDGWIGVLDATGSNFRYASYLGGADVDLGNAVGADDLGNAYISGWTQSSNFPVTAAAFDPTHNYAGPFPSPGPPGTTGAEDVYLTRVAADGSQISYSTYIGGSGIDVAYALHVHQVGSVYLTGGTRSVDFPTTPGSFDTTYNGINGDQDAYILLMPGGEQACENQAVSTQYGTGKAGKNGIPVWAAVSDAEVGGTATLQLTQAHENVPVFVLLGIQPDNLPVAGGTLLVKPLAVIFGMTDALGQFSLSGSIDENPNFCGVSWFSQVLVDDPTVFLASMSNGLELELGS